MAIKTSAVLEDTVQRIPIAELTAGAPLFEWTIPLRESDSQASLEPIIQIEPDNPQIALVAFQSGQDRAGGGPQRAGRMDRPLLFPLASRALVTRVRNEPRAAASFNIKN